MMIGTYFSVNTDTTYNVSIDYVAFKNALTAGSKVIFRDSAGNDMVVTGYASTADTYYVIIGANRSTGLLSYDVSLGWIYYNVAVPQNFSELSGAIVTSQIASKAVTPAKIDYTNMYVGDEKTSAVTVTTSNTIVQSIDLPVGKWKVFLQFRLVMTGMGANASQSSWVGFKDGDSVSSPNILEEGVNIYSDWNGTVRNLYNLASPVINVTSAKTVSSYVRVSSAYSGASVSNGEAVVTLRRQEPAAAVTPSALTVTPVRRSRPSMAVTVWLRYSGMS